MASSAATVSKVSIPEISDIEVDKITLGERRQEGKTYFWNFNGEKRFRLKGRVLFPAKPSALPRTAEGLATRQGNTVGPGAYSSTEPLELVIEADDEDFYAAEFNSRIRQLYYAATADLKGKLHPETADQVDMTYAAPFRPGNRMCQQLMHLTILGWGGAVQLATLRKSSKSSAKDFVSSATFGTFPYGLKLPKSAARFYMNVADKGSAPVYTDNVLLTEDGALISDSPAVETAHSEPLFRHIGPQDVTGCSGTFDVSLSQLSVSSAPGNNGHPNLQVTLHSIEFEPPAVALDPVYPMTVAPAVLAPPASTISFIQRRQAEIRALKAAAAEQQAMLPPLPHDDGASGSRKRPRKDKEAAADFSAVSTTTTAPPTEAELDEHADRVVEAVLGATD